MKCMKGLPHLLRATAHRLLAEGMPEQSVVRARVWPCRRRVKAGDWLGPSGLCNTLEALVNRVQPGGLHCRVVATSGGGAPVLCISK
jgi:hypothetical protein